MTDDNVGEQNRVIEKGFMKNTQENLQNKEAWQQTLQP